MKHPHFLCLCTLVNKSSWTVVNVAMLAMFWCDYSELLYMIAPADKASFSLEWGSRCRPRQEGEMNGFHILTRWRKKCHDTQRQAAEDLNSTGKKLSETRAGLGCTTGWSVIMNTSAVSSIKLYFTFFCNIVYWIVLLFYISRHYWCVISGSTCDIVHSLSFSLSEVLELTLSLSQRADMTVFTSDACDSVQ